jgi:hypothetical protein
MEARSRESKTESVESQRFEAEIIKGVESGPSTDFTKEDWESIRREVLARHRKRMQKDSA